MRNSCCLLNAFVCFIAISAGLAKIQSNSLAGVHSAAADFTAASAPPASNDLFGNALKVNAQPVFVHSASTFAATLEPGENLLAHGGVANAVSSIWYTWSVRERTEVLVDTAGSSYGTVIGVYSGTSIAALTRVSGTSSAEQGRDAWVRFVAEPNVSYKIAVAGIPPTTTGIARVRFEVNGQPDLAPPLLEITRPVSGTTIREPRVRIEGFAIDPLPDASGIREIQYSLSTEGDAVIRTAQGSTNFSATVDLILGENIVTMWAIDSADQTSAWRRVSVMLNQTTSTNDLFVDRFVLDHAANARVDSNLDARKEPGEPAHAGNPGGASIWYEFAAGQSGVLLLSTVGSTFDTLLAVYSPLNTPAENPRVTNLVEIASSDDVPGGGGYSELTVAVEQGKQYFIAVDGFDGQIGTAQLSYRFSPTPVYLVTLLPVIGSGTVIPGGGVYPENATVTFRADPGPGFVFAHFETPSGPVRQNPFSLVVNENTELRAVFQPRVYSEDFEDGFSFLFEGAGWSVQMDPTNRANHIFAAHGNGQDRTTNTVSLTLRVSEGLGSFDFGVSSETNFDRLEFSVAYLQDGLESSRTQLGSWSGETRGRSQFALRSGTVRLEWRYAKDAAISDGRDWAFIDNLDLPLFSAQPVVTIADETVTLRLSGLGSQVLRVETSADLVNWTPVRTATPDTEGDVRISERANSTLRFYRFIPVLLE